MNFNKWQHTDLVGKPDEKGEGSLMSGWTPIMTYKLVQHLRDEEIAQFFDSHYKEEGYEENDEPEQSQLENNKLMMPLPSLR
jgi:hypothetical protein